MVQRLASYTKPAFNADNRGLLLLDTKIMQLIRKLLTVYECYTLANSLLGGALLEPKLESFFNATLIYKLAEALKSGELSMDELCANRPRLFNVCRDVRSMI
jgi:hypothetical protein